MTKFSEVDEIDESLAELEGEHPATITHAELPRDEETGGFLKYKPRPGTTGKPKGICDVKFKLDDEDREVSRRYAMSYNQNSENGQWAAWAELLAAACGVPCGSNNQQNLGTEDLEGQKCRVVLKMVAKNGNSYLNVINVLGPRKAKPGPKEQFTFTERPELEDEIAL